MGKEKKENLERDRGTHDLGRCYRPEEMRGIRISVTAVAAACIDHGCCVRAPRTKRARRVVGGARGRDHHRHRHHRGSVYSDGGVNTFIVFCAVRGLENLFFFFFLFLFCHHEIREMRIKNDT